MKPKNNIFTSALILAAGESKRMGKTKLILPIDKQSILNRTISNVISSSLNEVVVVIGCKANVLTDEIRSLGVKIVLNPNFKEGLSTSIISGLNQISERSEAFMVILGDQPFIGSVIINKIINKFKESKKGIVAPSYNGKLGHPVIFSLKYKEEFFKLKGDVGGKAIIQMYKNDVMDVPVSSEKILIDIDTPEDYRKYIKTNL